MATLRGAGDLSRRCAAQAIIDGTAKPGFGNRHDGDGLVLGAVERAQHGEQMSRRLDEVAVGRKIEHGPPAGTRGPKARSASFSPTVPTAPTPRRSGGTVQDS